MLSLADLGVLLPIGTALVSAAFSVARFRLCSLIDTAKQLADGGAHANRFPGGKFSL